MDFNLQADTPETGEFRKEVRGWFEENMRGSENLRWSASWSTRENEEEVRFRRELAEKLGKKGWLFPMFPVEYGGARLTIDHQLVLETELDRYGINLAHVFYTLARIVAPVILKWGTEEQKREFLPPMSRGEVSVWQVLTEPQGGSDIATCLTKAIRDGDHYVVNGQKTMVGYHHPPDFLWTLVCTDPSRPRHENLGWLYVPGNLPGITIQPMYLMMGLKNTVFFDNVRVPAKYLVGGENNGWRVANTHPELEHGGDGRVGVDPLVEGVEVLPADASRREVPHRGHERTGHHRRHDDRAPHRKPLCAAKLLASIRQGTASLWRCPVPVPPAYGAAQKRRAVAANHGLRCPGPGSYGK